MNGEIGTEMSEDSSRATTTTAIYTPNFVTKSESESLFEPSRKAEKNKTTTTTPREGVWL